MSLNQNFQNIISQILNLKPAYDDKIPDKWDKVTQQTFVLKSILKTWICSCIFYAIIILLKGFCPYFKLENIFIHEIFGFISLSGISGVVTGYYFRK